MNGQQQQERATAVTKLKDETAKEMENLKLALLSILDKERAIHVVEMEGLKSLFAKMVDDETAFRRAAIRAAIDGLRQDSATAISIVTGALMVFLRLVWWQRWLWVLVGPKALLWFPVKGLTAPSVYLEEIVPAKPTPVKSTYTSEKP